MAKVHDVDPRLIQRTQEWLASQQQPDGSWKPDPSFINVYPSAADFRLLSTN